MAPSSGWVIEINSFSFDRSALFILVISGVEVDTYNFMPIGVGVALGSDEIAREKVGILGAAFFEDCGNMMESVIWEEVGMG